MASDQPGRVEEKKLAISENLGPDSIICAFLTLLQLADCAFKSGRKQELSRDKLPLTPNAGYPMKLKQCTPGRRGRTRRRDVDATITRAHRSDPRSLQAPRPMHSRPLGADDGKSAHSSGPMRVWYASTGMMHILRSWLLLSAHEAAAGPCLASCSPVLARAYFKRFFIPSLSASKWILVRREEQLYTWVWVSDIILLRTKATQSCLQEFIKNF